MGESESSSNDEEKPDDRLQATLPRTHLKRRLLKMKGTKPPVEVDIHKSLKAAYPLESVYIFQIVDRLKSERGRREEAVWAVTPGFNMIGKLNGKVEHTGKISDITLVGVQSVFHGKEESKLILIQFAQHTADTTLILHLKPHRRNHPVVPADDLIGVLASIFHATTGNLLSVEHIPPNVDIFAEESVYGPFRPTERTMSASEKTVRKKNVSSLKPLQTEDSFPQYRGTKDPTDQSYISVLLPSPLGRSATTTAVTTNWYNHDPPSFPKGCLTKVRTTVKNSPWRVGEVVGTAADGSPIIRVGKEKPLIYPIYERIQPNSIYMAVRQTYATANPGDLQQPGDLVVEQNRRARIVTLEDVSKDTWGMLDTGSWVPITLSNTDVMLPCMLGDEESIPPLEVKSILGLNPGAFGNPEVDDADLEGSVDRAVKGAVEEKPRIKVFLRIRPVLDEKEQAADKAVTLLDANTVACRNQSFEFDEIFTQKTYQNEMLRRILPQPLRTVLSGHNASILAYGTSGSGKTYSMFGGGDTPGIVQCAMSEIVTAICEQDTAFTLRISFYELYAEKVKDLLGVALADTEKQRLREDTFKRRRVRTHPVTGPYIENMTQVDVMREDIPMILDKAKAIRATSATHGNPTSSRSHGIVTISVVRNDNRHATPNMLASTLTIVDLAGSERARRYRDDNMTEARSINLSLTVLRKVIDTLLRPSQQGGPPYRESLLTFLLSESLGGNSFTTLLATVSPCLQSADDTMATLRYASRARGIVNNVRSNTVPAVLETLAIASPQAARGLSMQNQVVTDVLGKISHYNVQQEEGVEELWKAIVNSKASGPKVLGTILEEVRVKERAAVMKETVVPVPRLSPTPPSGEDERLSPTPPSASSDEEDKDELFASPSCSPSPVAATPAMQQEDEILKKLARALASSAARMLSPSVERSAEKLPPVHRQHDKYDFLPIPSTMLARDMVLPAASPPAATPVKRKMYTSEAITPMTGASKGLRTPNSMRYEKSIRVSRDILDEDEEGEELSKEPMPVPVPPWTPVRSKTHEVQEASPELEFIATPPKSPVFVDPPTPPGYGLTPPRGQSSPLNEVSPLTTPSKSPIVCTLPTPPRSTKVISINPAEVPLMRPSLFQGISYTALPVQKRGEVWNPPMTKDLQHRMYAPLERFV